MGGGGGEGGGWVRAGVPWTLFVFGVPLPGVPQPVCVWEGRRGRVLAPAVCLALCGAGFGFLGGRGSHPVGLAGGAARGARVAARAAARPPATADGGASTDGRGERLLHLVGSGALCLAVPPRAPPPFRPPLPLRPCDGVQRGVGGGAVAQAGAGGTGRAAAGRRVSVGRVRARSRSRPGRGRLGGGGEGGQGDRPSALPGCWCVDGGGRVGCL